MGNKAGILPEVLAAIEACAPAGSLIVDPMAGSHAVSIALKPRYRLVTSDAQEYSAVLGRAFVDNVSVRRVPADFIERLESAARGRLRTDGRGYLEESFAETYLGALQCRHLDALRAAVDDEAPRADEPLRWLALSALITASCRAQATPGHFAQFLPANHPRTLELRKVDVLDVALTTLARFEVAEGLAGSVSFALPWSQLVAKEAGRLTGAAAWYVDPPYTADQYSRFYHFLETLVRGDRPALRFKARYREDRFQSTFCYRHRASAELRALLAAIRRVSPSAAVVLSYSSRGLLTRDELLGAADGLFDLANWREVGHVYSTQGKGNLGGVVEWIATLRPRGAQLS
jgi:adenine-specific DNA-methyltransferase